MYICTKIDDMICTQMYRNLWVEYLTVQKLHTMKN